MKEEMRKYFPERFENHTEKSFGPLGRYFGDLTVNYQSINDKQKCELKVGQIFEKSDELRLLRGAMNKYGCKFNVLRHVVCEKCQGCNGGFDPDYKQIIICQNASQDSGKILTTLMHEMIHMFDYCRAKFDFTNLEHIACTEIRAANLTYCSLTDKLQFPGESLFKIRAAHHDCVREVAFRSVKAYSPETEDSKISDIVNKVFVGCYNDLEPFGRRAINGSRDLKQSYRERFYYGYV